MECYQGIPDWPHLRQRYQAYWRREVVDGAIIVHIQNPVPRQHEPEPWMLDASDAKYLDPAKLFALNRWRRQAGWQWHGDLFDYVIASYGPNVFTGFCGGLPVFGADTVWHEPVIDSLAEADRIHFDESNRFWRAHLEAVDYVAARSAGNFMLAMTDFGGPADWISALMGTENFLLETLEHPDEMRDFALRLAEECNHAFDLVYPRLVSQHDGLANWMPCWSDRRMGTVQDDMAINFSPTMYAEVFLPAIQRMATHSEHTVLHWHSGCVHHLPTMLGVSALDVIQYGHDPNSPPFRDNLPYLQQIQDAGKCLFISCVQADDVEFFIDHLDPRGLMMIIDTENTDASLRMLDDVPRWTERRLAMLDAMG